MLKERARIVAATLFLLDLLQVAVGFVASWALRDIVLPRLWPEMGSLYPLASYLPLLPLALGLWGVALLASGHYRSARILPLPQETAGLLRSSILAGGSFALALFLFRLDPRFEISRFWLLLFPVTTSVALVAERLAVRLTSRIVRAQGFNYRTVILVGANGSGLDIADAMERHPYWGFKILGFLTAEGLSDPAVEARFRILGDVDDLPSILDQNVVDEVIFAVGKREMDRLEDQFLALEEQGIQTRFALNFFPHTQARVHLEDLDGLPLLTFGTTPGGVGRMVLKRTVDVGVSALILVLGLPLVLAIAVAIRVSSSGDVLFRQTRCGLNGRLFTLYKFRTMVRDAEDQRGRLEHLNEMDGPVFKVRRDPRITGLGRLLRRFSLDELPQLWNVLRGDMSLVGPRPPIPEEVAHYQRWQRRRLSMKPGLTCLWQISGRNEVDFDRWMELDLQYIDNWSPLLDLKILVRTIPAVLSGRGAS